MAQTQTVLLCLSVSELRTEEKKGNTARLIREIRGKKRARVCGVLVTNCAGNIVSAMRYEIMKVFL